MSKMIVTFDATGLSQVQRDALEAAVVAQGADSDDYPYIPSTVVEWVDTPNKEQVMSSEPCVLEDLDAHLPEILLDLKISEWPAGLTALEIHRGRHEWCDTVTLRGTREAIGDFVATYWYGDAPNNLFNGDLEGYTYDMSRIRTIAEYNQQRQS